jgi:hypothetical protein
MDLPFTAAIPAHWFAGNVTMSHSVNGLNLLFPAGERLFIRSVRRHLKYVECPHLRKRASAFFGQEARHGLEHERAFEILEAQGYEIRSWLDKYERWAFVLEPYVPAILPLAVTVAMEHFTAVFAENALTRNTLDHAHPVMADLMRWHSAEEIEHKSVAFDVYVAAGGTYPMRVAGGVLALLHLLAIWGSAVRHLMRQETLTSEAWAADRKRAAELTQPDGLYGALVDFCRPGFHPDNHNNYKLAAEWLTSVGRLEA